MSKASLATVQERGQVTIPVEIRRYLGLEKGDMVAFVVIEDGVLLKPQRPIAADELAQLGKILREKGIDIEDLKKNGASTDLLTLLEHPDRMDADKEIQFQKKEAQ